MSEAPFASSQPGVESRCGSDGTIVTQTGN